MADDMPAETKPAVAEGAADAPAAVPLAVAALSGAVASATASAAGTPGPGTGATTPALDPDQIDKSLRVSLADLTAKATALYVHKNYEDAAELFSQAAQMQSEMNGEMNPRNAEICFLYGRALIKVGQSKSDVFGSKAPDTKKAKPAAKKAAKPTKAAGESSEAKPEEPSPAERITEEGVAIAAAEAGGAKDDSAQPKKPLFQFEGDDNLVDSDSDGEEAAEGEEQEEEEDEDDLATAFEILEMARVLYEKQLKELEEESSEAKGKEKAEGDSPSLRHVKERLGDTHDLLAEISLECERFKDAIPDFRKSLSYRKDLYPQDHELIAEAHFKLSLALEFASVVADNDDKSESVQHVDQALRDEAATELEAAIASTKLKLQNQEVELAMNHSPDDNDVTRKEITDIKEVIADMEQRLVELRGMPVDVEKLLGKDNPLSGILGAALGETPGQVEARVQEATKNATDLSGLVRKKKAPAAEEEKPAVVDADGANGSAANANANANANAKSNGKRKLDETDADAEASDDSTSKKARVEDVVSAES
ncbi:hypothetical protein RB594_009122 [Gaeumannomyces avenae]